MPAAPFETFPLLSQETWLRHAFLRRVPGLSLAVERAEALARLASYHRQAIEQIGLGAAAVVFAEQVHGKNVVRVDASTPAPVAACDGLITNDPDAALGIYTADCGAIYLADPVHRAIGLLHSGKKGTELGILLAAIQAMQSAFGSEPAQLLVQLAPCIRPPHYEVDFAAQIRDQALQAGVTQWVDCGECTAAHLDRYYSYRAEKGKTGRMLAVMGYAD